MLKRTITFKDLDGNDVTEDFYFNLSTVELAEMEMGEGLATKLETIIKLDDTSQIFMAFKDIITKAIGKRSEDGKRFIKSQEAIDEFFQSNAYEVLFLEWIGDGNAAAEFINGVMPSDLETTVEKITGKKPVTDVSLPASEPDWIKEGRVPKPEELVGATQEQLQEAFRRQAAPKPVSPS